MILLVVIVTDLRLITMNRMFSFILTFQIGVLKCKFEIQSEQELQLERN